MMRRLIPVLIITLAAVLTLSGPGSTATAQIKLQRFERDVLSIETADGQRHRLEVELAVTGRQHAQGLMYRRSLAKDAGMLFLYGGAGMLSMWMKNTAIPLDMMFIGPDGRIVDIAERTVPYSLETISAQFAASAVLEVNGGTVARLGIQPGDRVLHRAFGNGS
jgi:uncharacterized membrane protein (UPF0127 family)